MEIFINVTFLAGGGGLQLTSEFNEVAEGDLDGANRR